MIENVIWLKFIYYRKISMTLWPCDIEQNPAAASLLCVQSHGVHFQLCTSQLGGKLDFSKSIVEDGHKMGLNFSVATYATRRRGWWLTGWWGRYQLLLLVFWERFISTSCMIQNHADILGYLKGLMPNQEPAASWFQPVLAIAGAMHTLEQFGEHIMSGFSPASMRRQESWDVRVIILDTSYTMT